MIEAVTFGFVSRDAFAVEPAIYRVNAYPVLFAFGALFAFDATAKTFVSFGVVVFDATSMLDAIHTFSAIPSAVNLCGCSVECLFAGWACFHGREGITPDGQCPV